MNTGQRMAQPDAVLFNGGFCTPTFTRERIAEAISTWFGEDGRRRAKPMASQAPRKPSGRKCGGSRRRLLRTRAPRRRLARQGRQRPRLLHRPACGGRRRRSARHLRPARRLRSRNHAPSARPRIHRAGQPPRLVHALQLAHPPRCARRNRYAGRSGVPSSRSAGEPVALRQKNARALPQGASAGRLHRGRHARALVRIAGDRPSLAPAIRTARRRSGSAAVGSASLRKASRHALPPQPRRLRLRRATHPQRFTDSTEPDAPAPETLVSQLEAALGAKRDQWPIAVVRGLADVLLESAPGRKHSPRHELRWLNLLGFCLRPGFGFPGDVARIHKLWAVAPAAPIFADDLQCQVEMLAMLRRIRWRHQRQPAAGALSRTHQRRRPGRNPAATASSNTRSGACSPAWSIYPPASAPRWAVSC